MVEWYDRFNVNISILDEEHKKFFDLIYKTTKEESFSNNPKGALEVLDEMTEYALEHFKTEENYMEKFHFTGYQSHKNEHIDFVNTTTDYKNRAAGGDDQVISEILEYLLKWLVNHIQVTDRKYIDCFKENGLK